jgi:hypothetical protein
MERKVKHQILKMLIPVIGTWWLIKRILPDLGEITWWDVSRKSIPLTIGLVFYQAICWIGWKVFYMMHFFGYTFEQVFTKW